MRHYSTVGVTSVCDISAEKLNPPLCEKDIKLKLKIYYAHTQQTFSYIDLKYPMSIRARFVQQCITFIVLLENSCVSIKIPCKCCLSLPMVIEDNFSWEMRNRILIILSKQQNLKSYKSIYNTKFKQSFYYDLCFSFAYSTHSIRPWHLSI